MFVIMNVTYTWVGINCRFLITKCILLNKQETTHFMNVGVNEVCFKNNTYLILDNIWTNQYLYQSYMLSNFNMTLTFVWSWQTRSYFSNLLFSIYSLEVLRFIHIAVSYKIFLLTEFCNLYSRGTGPQAFSMICCAPINGVTEYAS